MWWRRITTTTNEGAVIRVGRFTGADDVLICDHYLTMPTLITAGDYSMHARFTGADDVLTYATAT